MAKYKPIIPGDRFGKFVVQGLAPPKITLTPRKYTRTMHHVLCDCGKAKIVSRDSLLSGRSQSCGCRVQAKRAVSPQGYWLIGARLEHIVIAERVLGRPLPEGAEVHHFNEDKTNNRPANLVICPSGAYHKLLHYRAKAYDACGHADWLKCGYCKQYDDPSLMEIRDRGLKGRYCYHRPACPERRAYQALSRRKYRAKRKAVMACDGAAYEFDALGFM